MLQSLITSVVSQQRPISWGGALQRGSWPTRKFGLVGHNAFGPTNNWLAFSLF